MIHRRPYPMHEPANSLWPPLASTVDEPPAPPQPAFALNPALLAALAASGERLGGAANLAEWRAILSAEVAAYLPGAVCTIYLSPEWPPFQPTAADPVLIVPL